MNGDPSTLLLEKLTSGPGTAPRMSEVLAQLGEADPRMALLAKYFAQRETEQSDDEEDPPVEAERRRESFERLQRILKRLYAELEELRQRNDGLAAALGACYLCWGENPECDLCAGTGVPGSRAPDEILLSHYVTPAVRRRPAAPPFLNGNSTHPDPDLPKNPQ